ncbi:MULTISPECIES: SAM-dependent methyltransferase [Streptacidiphilus]|uniref:SAM-dependent methyltransferase n=1 Tax=Streptacidiphilus cavernicola TaxID=3342716 RepID=A0ABV6UL30_9ACTN|nr:SAM-dependent methyltransferase [Streptacidiphilus jeojiense]
MSRDVFSGAALGSASSPEPWVPPVIDTGVAHPARMYDYYLGGKDNFPADREAAERILAVGPQTRVFAQANRAFLGRAVRFLAEQGIDQFLDIGTGIPAAGNTHEVAQSVNPAARVAYVDNDPIVLAHARALMAGHGLGATTVVQADLRDPAAILADPAVRAAIDFDRPVALMLVAVLHFVTEAEDPDAVTALLRDALPSGSYLVLSHATGDFVPPAQATDARTITEVYKQRATSPLTLRTGDRIREFFGDFALLDPGLVQVPYWRPEQEVPAEMAQVVFYGGVARKA